MNSAGWLRVSEPIRSEWTVSRCLCAICCAGHFRLGKFWRPTGAIRHARGLQANYRGSSMDFRESASSCAISCRKAIASLE